MSFREHMDTAFRSTSTRIGEFYPFLEFGLYGEQVERYLQHVRKRQNQNFPVRRISERSSNARPEYFQVPRSGRDIRAGHERTAYGFPCSSLVRR